MPGRQARVKEPGEDEGYDKHVADLAPMVAGEVVDEMFGMLMIMR